MAFACLCSAMTFFADYLNFVECILIYDCFVSIRSDNLILLRDNQPESVGLEVYGKDANSIIQSVMRSNERPERVKKMFEVFYSAVDEGKLDKARMILTTIEDEIGTDDPEAAACEVQLSLEEA